MWVWLGCEWAQIQSTGQFNLSGVLLDPLQVYHTISASSSFTWGVIYNHPGRKILLLSLSLSIFRVVHYSFGQLHPLFTHSQPIYYRIERIQAWTRVFVQCSVLFFLRRVDSKSCFAGSNKDCLANCRREKYLRWMVGLGDALNHASITHSLVEAVALFPPLRFVNSGVFLVWSN